MKNSYQDDEAFITLIINGDKKAYNHLVETYHKRIFAYIISLTSDYDIAQDLVQNVFLKTWEFRDRLNPSFSIKSFLYKSAYHEFINQYHKNKSISSLEKVYFEALEESVLDENIEISEQKKLLIHEEIEKLPTKCKQIFSLSKKEGLSNLEISEHLSISIKTVEGQITKAYSILRKNCMDKISPYQLLILISLIKDSY
ncbi:sigma-70 family RNA polymerase sigma factor [Wenyingzhuangia sp. 1_MG-2023]|nr:sigma-70 family RNA polymerase sigma factor [Wenyingzhuangia sp. 1_MG-2023]